jgi:NAD+ kinase
MKVAIFGKVYAPENRDYIQQLVDKLQSHHISLIFYEPFYQKIKNDIVVKSEISFFNGNEGLKNKVDFLFSIGGDGTLLDTITFVQDSGIPILGINLVRMGFLSSVSKDQIETAFEQFIHKQFKLDHRTLIRLVTKDKLFGELNYALNECTVYKKDPFSMLKIQAFVNGEFLNSYWADGLIIATPTGSTAYSLSNGGPIILPRSQNFVITPIATHNLTVRPIVIPDSSEIRIKVTGRIKEFFVSLDSRSQAIDASMELILVKEEFKVNLLQLENESYFKTIRQKLLWGIDLRN